MSNRAVAGLLRVRWLAPLFAVLAASGCPPSDAAGDPGPGAPAPAAESGLAVGQRYTFAMGGGMGQTRQVYEVTAVDQGAILYRVETLLEGDPVGEPLRNQRFPLVPRMAAALDAAVGRETLVISGRAFDCRITERDGQRVYTATGPDGIAFPGVVKVIAQDTDAALVELIRVE